MSKERRQRRTKSEGGERKASILKIEKIGRQ